MRPTIKIVYDTLEKDDNVFYISYEKLLELIDKEAVDIIDVEIFR